MPTPAVAATTALPETSAPSPGAFAEAFAAGFAVGIFEALAKQCLKLRGRQILLNEAGRADVRYIFIQQRLAGGGEPQHLLNGWRGTLIHHAINEHTNSRSQHLY